MQHNSSRYPQNMLMAAPIHYHGNCLPLNFQKVPLSSGVSDCTTVSIPVTLSSTDRVGFGLPVDNVKQCQHNAVRGCSKPYAIDSLRFMYLYKDADLILVYLVQEGGPCLYQHALWQVQYSQPSHSILLFKPWHEQLYAWLNSQAAYVVYRPGDIVTKIY